MKKIRICVVGQSKCLPCSMWSDSTSVILALSIGFHVGATGAGIDACASCTEKLIVAVEGAFEMKAAALS